MHSINEYSKHLVSKVREEIEAGIAAIEGLKIEASLKAEHDKLSKLLADIEPIYIRALLFQLDAHFIHRNREKEGRDGNALNEVRMLSDSIVQSGGVMTHISDIQYKPEESVAKIGLGEEIKITAHTLKLLAEAYLKEIEAKFVRH